MSLLDEVRAALQAAHRDRGQMLDMAAGEKRSFTDAEESKFQALGTKHAGLVERVSQLERQEKSELAARPARIINAGGFTAESRGGTYHPGEGSHSFFRDLVNARHGDADSSDRLRTNNQEQRALGSYTTGGAAEFSPPGYLDIVPQVRAGSVFASLLHQEQLPTGVSSVNLPRVTASGGTTTGVQVLQGDAISNTDIVSDLLTSKVVTIAGGQVASLQLLAQTPSYNGSTVDQILTQDLASSYAASLDKQALYGTGANGQLKGFIVASVAAAANNNTWTQASPTVPLLFSQIGKVTSQVAATRFAPVDTLVVAPRRFAWIASSVDSTGHPFVNAQGSNGLNNLAEQTAVAAEGRVGTIQGIEVFADANLPLTYGTGNNQDPVLAFKRDDCWLWSSPIVAEVLEQPYAATLGVYIRLYAYHALIVDRYPSSLGMIMGALATGSTGLVSPSFLG